jgi:hypothetical protein
MGPLYELRQSLGQRVPNILSRIIFVLSIHLPSLDFLQATHFGIIKEILICFDIIGEKIHFLSLHSFSSQNDQGILMNLQLLSCDLQNMVSYAIYIMKYYSKIS